MHASIQFEHRNRNRGGQGGGGGGGAGGDQPPNAGAIKGIFNFEMDYFITFQPFLQQKFF